MNMPPTEALITESSVIHEFSLLSLFQLSATTGRSPAHFEKAFLTVAEMNQ
jgi:hypothetical protein